MGAPDAPVVAVADATNVSICWSVRLHLRLPRHSRPPTVVAWSAISVRLSAPNQPRADKRHAVRRLHLDVGRHSLCGSASANHAVSAGSVAGSFDMTSHVRIETTGYRVQKQDSIPNSQEVEQNWAEPVEISRDF
jgi:hypothetical protein